MVIHFHQPVGNYDYVFEKACKVCYGPFLKMLSDYPDVKMALHFTGCLLEWLEEHRGDLLERISHLVSRGQVELLTGGFYEPILTQIPRRDALNQVALLTQYIHSRFGIHPVGAWNAERIWEPHLPSILGERGVTYTIIDENFLKYAGVEEEKTYGYFMTEDQGKAVAVFPSSKKLRYFIPFQEVDETVDFLKRISTRDGHRLLVYGDDAEKFGLWPETHKWVFGQGWLKRFFNMLVQNRDWIHLVTPSEYLSKYPPVDRVYLPTASYDEMMGWALPAKMGTLFENILAEVKDEGNGDVYGPFLRGGYWRNFLTKYPESNHMHKRMIYVSDKVNKAARKKVSRAKVKKVQQELFRAQCNCAYWHGVFGGLYLGHLRSAIYEHLIKAETLADKILHKRRMWLAIEQLDFDCDGQEEILVSTPDSSLCLDVNGGMITEWDYRPRSLNLVNTLSRRPEAYHRHIVSTPEPKKPSEGKIQSIHDITISKEKGLEKLLVYDSYRRGILIDHFLGEDVTLQQFSLGQYRKLGDFTDQPYSLDNIDTPKPTETILYFQRKGHVAKRTVSVEKNILIHARRPEIGVTYTITNPGRKEIEFVFGSECNFSLWHPQLRKRPRSFRKSSQFELAGQTEGFAIRFQFSQEAKMWTYPVQTISQSESGIEKTYQGISLLPHWRIKIGPREKKRINFVLAIVKTST